MQAYQEHAFKGKVEKAIARIRTVLDAGRSPQIAEDVGHRYEDKYLLAEFLANTSLASQVNVFESIGLTTKKLNKLTEWGSSRSVTLRLKSEETCTFLREVTREEESKTTHETTFIGGLTRKSKVMTKITEWFWNFEVKWELFAFKGNNLDRTISLMSRTGRTELKTTSEVTPYPKVVARPAIDYNMTWFLDQIDAEGEMGFSINRSAKECRTPRRNLEVTAALHATAELYVWAEKIHSYFMGTLFKVPQNHGLDLSSLNTDSLFVPIVPLFEDEATRPAALKEVESEETLSGVLPLDFVNPFLEEQKRAIEEKVDELHKVFPEDDKLAPFISQDEAELVLASLHLKDIANAYSNSLDYIEEMIRAQLIAAIGKEVGPVDFTKYMRFHNRKLFKTQYLPKPFAYAIRRPGNSPEGMISIESALADGSLPEFIPTIASSHTATKPMKFPLDAASEVKFYGKRYLHGWIDNQFSGATGSTLSLVSSARQFSSYILLVGNILSADTFDPKYGIIVKDKDELRIPLDMETIPTPQEFKDAIESLSPEQQRFAKGFRSMQLESTLFGICVIQIKPQLEKLLKLPAESLTKEIALSQHLLKLFMEYQIPSDLLSYDGPDKATSFVAPTLLAASSDALAPVVGPPGTISFKVDTVRKYANNIESMLTDAKNASIKDAQEVATLDFLVDQRSSLPQKPPIFKKLESPKSNIKKKRKMKKKSAAPSSSMSSLSSGKVSSSVRKPSPAPPQPSPTLAPTPAPVAVSTPAPEVAGVIERAEASSALVVPADDDLYDFTAVPALLEAQYDEFDEDNALRPTIISAGTTWAKKSCKSLLAKPASSTLGNEELKTAKNSAFDLLDALTKSGAIPVDHAELHVIVAATHCFDRTLMNTVVQDNVNPIEKVERSSLILASTIHGAPAASLVSAGQLSRVEGFNPKLLAPPSDGSEQN